MKRYLLLIFALCQYILLSENMKWQNIINYADHGHNFVGISKADSMNIMAFVDNELWSISPQRIILKSTDAGLNWVTVYQDTVKSWNIAKNIFYATKDFAIATCDNNYFLITTNGGLHWEEQLINFPKSTNGIVYISLLNSIYGVIGTYKDIAYSNDGFKTYKILNLKQKMLLTSIRIISPTKILFLSNVPYGFYKYDISNDSLEQYQLPVYSPINESPEDMYFSDSLNGIVIGLKRTGIGQASDDMIHKTTDGGKTWVEVLNSHNPPLGGLSKTDFYDNENGIVVGESGKIYWTYDRGNTWVHDYQKAICDSQAAVLHVTMLNKNTAIIADFLGTIWRSSLVTDIPEEGKDEKCYQCNFEGEYLVITNNNQSKSTVKVEIYDLLGNLLNQTTKNSNSNTLKIDINSLISIKGVYVYRVYLNDIFYCTGKYIK